MNELMVPVEAGRVWAHDSGGGKPALLVLHPGVGDSRIWEPVLPSLAERFRVIRYDARGYGRSPAPRAPFTYYGDFLAVVEHFGLDRFGLVGCSMGGGVATTFALDHPEKVTGLVLVCPGFPGFDWPDDPDTEAAFAAAERAEDVVAAAAEVGLRLWARSGDDPVAREQLRSAAAGWIAEEEFLGEEPPVFDRLEHLAVPTTLMIGDADRPPLIDSNEQAAKRIPGCRLIRMPGVDHLPPLREPELVAGAVMERFAG